MGKTSQTIRMLQILSSRDIVSKKELAQLLETNQRNIPEYKKELEMAGYYIEGIKGVYGGLRLERSEMMPSVKLSEDEKKVLQESLDYINHRYDFLKSKEYNLAMGKIFASQGNIPQSEIDELYIDRFPLIMDKEQLRHRYDMMKHAIKNHLKVEIDYLNSHNEVKKRVIHPYYLYNYNMSSYVLAYMDFGKKLSDQPMYFKLNRIESYKVLKDTFSPIKTFDSAKYLDSYGMKNNGEYYSLEIELKAPYAALIKERVYGKNQEIVSIDKDTTILKCEMQNKENIVAFILGFGSKAKVIAPLEIKEAVREEIKRMYSEE